MTYPVREDTLLLKDRIEDMELSGKKVLEIGTGNGAVAVAAAASGADVVATDVDPEALDDARERAREEEVEQRIEFTESDLFGSVTGEFDLILFNPPYLPGKKVEGSTWRGGEEGTELTSRFLEEARHYLKDGGEIIFVASSLSDLERLRQKHSIEKLDDRKLWFEELYLFGSD